MVWPAHAGEPAPWRTDPRLARRFHPDFKDDIQVVVPNPDSANGKRREVIWVRMLAADSATGRFLAYSLNEPDDLRGLHEGDNLVFTWDAKGYPVALTSEEGYGQAGWPSAHRRDPEFRTLVEGLRHYRMGNMGHNMPEIEACIRTLRPLARRTLTDRPVEEQFLTYFVFGRCLAESYQTLDAIDAFRHAIAAGPDSMDAHMAFLAELSVMVLKSLAEQYPDSASAGWEADFIAERDLVARRFGGDPAVRFMLNVMHDEKSAGDLSHVSPARLAVLRRTTFAVIRWKQR